MTTKPTPAHPELRQRITGRPEAPAIETTIAQPPGAAAALAPEPATNPDWADFERLADEWVRERPRGLDLHFTTEHPAYQQIIAMGPPAVPWLLQRLAERPDHWFAALHQITGASPVPPESRGRFREMIDAWLEWGRQQGYTWESAADADMD